MNHISFSLFTPVLLIIITCSCVEEKDPVRDNPSVIPSKIILRKPQGAVETKRTMKVVHNSDIGILMNSTYMLDGKAELVISRENAISMGISGDKYDEYKAYLETL